MSRKRTGFPRGGIPGWLKDVCEWLFQNKQGEKRDAGDGKRERNRHRASGSSGTSFRSAGEQKRHGKNCPTEVRSIQPADGKPGKGEGTGTPTPGPGTAVRSDTGKEERSKGPGTAVRICSGNKEAQDTSEEKKAAGKPEKESTRVFPGADRSGKNNKAADDSEAYNVSAVISDEEAFAGLNYVTCMNCLATVSIDKKTCPKCGKPMNYSYSSSKK